MSQFYAEIQGSRGPATRQGTKASGLRAHIRGWTVGVRVVLEHENGEDVCTVFRTEGSHGGTADKLLARYTKASA